MSRSSGRNLKNLEANSDQNPWNFCYPSQDTNPDFKEAATPTPQPTNNPNANLPNHQHYSKSSKPAIMHESAASQLQKEASQKAHRDLQSIEYKRNCRALIEDLRWTNMNRYQMGKLHRREVLASHSQITKHSVDYNPVTLEYHQDVPGHSLERLDQDRRKAIEERSRNLYLKNNTYNPIIGAPIQEHDNLIKYEEWRRHY